jgi:hypothetical protein
MKRATKLEKGRYQITIKGHAYRIVKGGNLNPGWWIWEGKKCQWRGKSKFNCEVFLNYKNPAYLSCDVRYFRN